jgi:hypothetical protein
MQVKPRVKTTTTKIGPTGFSLHHTHFRVIVVLLWWILNHAHKGSTRLKNTIGFHLHVNTTLQAIELAQRLNTIWVSDCRWVAWTTRADNNTEPSRKIGAGRRLLCRSWVRPENTGSRNGPESSEITNCGGELTRALVLLETEQAGVCDRRARHAETWSGLSTRSRNPQTCSVSGGLGGWKRNQARTSEQLDPETRSRQRTENKIVVARR